MAKGPIMTPSIQAVRTSLLVGTCGVAAAAFLAIATMTMSSEPALALPAYAQQTGKPCGFCHSNPAGSGKLTASGEKYKAKGHKL
jgi:hypothetical protein